MKKKVLPVILVIVLIIMLGAAYAGTIIYKKFSYSTKKADLNTYFSITDENDVPIVLQNDRIDNHARIIDGVYYLDFDSVQTLLNDRFYYGKADGSLIYTLPDKIITAPIGSTSYTSSDGATRDFGFQIARVENEKLYVALDYVKEYTNFYYKTFTNPNHMQVYTDFSEMNVASVKKDTKLRLRGGVKSSILTDLKKGDKVVVLEELDNWSKVKSPDSFIGYVENKFISSIQKASVCDKSDYVKPEYIGNSLDGKVNLAWHSIAGNVGSDSYYTVMSRTKGVNVIAPTWFQLCDNAGNINSLVNDSYIQAAHNAGIKVWATLDNFNNSFFTSGQGKTDTVLATAGTRANLIGNIMGQLGAHNIDGLNVDLEFVGSELEDISNNKGENYIEFIRELSIACRQNGKTLSVDVPVPFGNSFFHRKELGTVCDYVVIMGYDEHYSGSKEAGSVASIDYVEKGILKTLEDVPANKVVNGVPLYTRIWFTTSDGTVSSKAGSITWAKEFISQNGIQMDWNPACGQNYGETVRADGTKVQIWLEDAQSIQQKIDVMTHNQLAGIAEWQIGYTSPDDVWTVIQQYLLQ